MRVIAGAERGRRLRGPTTQSLRPTSDRVREALFSILGSRVPGARILDLYAGTGAVGLEALSRGAAHASFVETSPRALRILRDNLARCGAEPRTRVYATSVQGFLQRCRDDQAPYDIVFADPPYESTAWLATLARLTEGRVVRPSTVTIVEHATRRPAPARLGQWGLVRQYRYGDTTLSLFALGPERTTPR